MKNVYRVKRINTAKINTLDEYREAVKRASIVYCTGIDELRSYCGGRLHRTRTGGYCGTNGNIEYVAERIQ